MVIDHLAEQIGAIAERLQKLAGPGTELSPAHAFVLAEVCADLRTVEERLKAEETADRQTEAELAARVRQQAAVAALGLSALAGHNLQALMDDAARIVAETLQVELIKVLELLPGHDALLLRAGVGWQPGLVGQAIVAGGAASQSGFTLAASEPVVVTDLRTDQRFIAPKLLHDHGAISGLSVIIHGRERPFGVLSAHTTRQRVFTQDDVNFLQAAANTLATAIERRRSEAAIAFQAHLLDSVEQAVIASDIDGSIIYWNRFAERLYGWTAAEARGRNVVELVPATAVKGEAAEIMDLLRQGKSWTGEFLVQHRDGATFPTLVIDSPIYDDQGQVSGIVGVSSDITDRKQAEEALRRSRDELEIILRGVGDGITVQDPSGRLIFANEAAVRLIGFDTVGSLITASPAEVLGRFEVLDEYGQAVALSNLPGRRALQGETVPETLLRFRIRATGEERWSMVNATPVFDESGQVLLAINIFHDVTQRMHYEETLRFQVKASMLLSESLDYSTTLMNLARLAVPHLADWCIVAMLDPDGNLQQLAATHTDPRRVQLLTELREHYPFGSAEDFGAAQVVRTGHSELYADISDSGVARTFKDPLQHQIFQQLGLKSAMIVPLIARGQILGTISFMSAESGRRFSQDDLAVAEDLAHRAALAIDQARLYREAQEAVHLRDEFLSIAAHELKTPVTALLGYTQVLQRRAAREESANQRDQRALSVIATQSERLARLIGTLLDISRIETGYFTIEQQLMDLSALVERVTGEMLPMLHTHTMVCSGIDEPLMLYGDEARLEQVFQNLLQNAVKYSPEGGQIEVSVERHTSSASVSIRDQGIGIPEAARERLFQRFFRASNVATATIGGMGIGLYVVREIVSRHAGTVTVESTEGQGSTFVVRLPLAPVLEST